MTTNDNRKMVTGLFRDRESAENAYSTLEQRGYGKDDVNLVMSDEARQRHFAGDGIETELGTKAAAGAGVGAGVGGAIGAVLGGIAAVGTSIAIPGLGLVIAGPLAAAIAGAGAGGATGGLLGALIGYGIPEERIVHYEEGIKSGGILMGVTPRSDEDAKYIEDEWTAGRGEHVIGTGVGAGAGALAGAAVGSAAGPIGTAAGAVVGAVTGGLAGKGLGEVVNPKAGDELDDHNLAKGTGAGGGAMAGAAIGAAGGPVGMAAGAAIGAVAGGAIGQGAAQALNPAEEEGYWRQTYTHEPYFDSSKTYDDYGPAYQLGYTAADRYDGSFETRESELSNEWNGVKANSRLNWDEAKQAARAAWNRRARS